MPDIDFLKTFFEGNPPKNLRILVAKGLVPLPPHQVLVVQVRLARDPDPEVAEKATETLQGLAEKDLLLQLQAADCSPEVLEYFAGSDSPSIQEAIILNVAASGPVIVALASHVPAPLLETILYNRTRVLESPQILESIKGNPAATPQILGQVKEIESEFFSSKKRDYAVGAAEAESTEQALTLELEGELPLNELFLEGLPLDPKEREAVIQSRIASLSVRQKVQLALMGTREARAVLVRDSNKEVARSVLQSPKLTAAEVESFSAMRNISDEVLRQIAISKEWTRNYAVLQNLVKNPKTPPMLSQRMLNRLHSKDLQSITRDRGLSELVRRDAERLLRHRNAAKSMG
jgi:hypothetical protein